MYGWCSKSVIPKDHSLKLRSLVKECFASNTRYSSLKERLDLLNPRLRGWSSYYRYAWGAKKVFCALDSWVWWTITRWLRAKHPKVNMQRLRARYGWRRPGCRAWRWRDGETIVFEMANQRVGRYRGERTKTPDFMPTSMESPVHNERCTPGSERGARKPTGATR